MASEENIIQAAGIKLCRQHPKVGRIYRTQSGKVKVKGGFMNLCPAGTPDTTGFMVDGRIIGIEYKTPAAFKNKDHGASEDQLEHLNDIKQAGGIAGIASNMEQVRQILAGVHIGLEEPAGRDDQLSLMVS
ncbi:MAG: hypothetical protein COB36_12100 [Alphaproteobacteria bacterium]|nr:MAG: hypothetical protein COB36_12100 [Alphaproteobacteria bacterium]